MSNAELGGLAAGLGAAGAGLRARQHRARRHLSTVSFAPRPPSTSLRLPSTSLSTAPGGPEERDVELDRLLPPAPAVSAQGASCAAQSEQEHSAVFGQILELPDQVARCEVRLMV